MIEQFRKQLAGLDGFNVEVFESIPSTNDYLFGPNGADKPSWTVAVADEQTAGRGRLRRHWSSRPGIGLWFSILIRNPQLGGKTNLLNLLTAVTLAEFLDQKLQEYGKDESKTRLKWPNDIFCRGKKICGILLQTSYSGNRIGHVVLGIGLNVNHQRSDFPPEIQTLATSLAIESGTIWDRATLFGEFLIKLRHEVATYLPARSSEIVSRYMQRVIQQGEAVTVTHGEARIQGVFKSLTPEGFMVLARKDGDLVITTGEVG